MADEVDVTPASPEDIPTIASIWPQTMRTNPVMDFVFSNHLYGCSAPRKYVHHMYEQAFRQGTSHFAKATCKETCEMVGYMSFRVEDGKGNDKQNSKAPHPLLRDADLELYDMYFGGHAKKEKKHVSSCQRQHYTCNHRSSAHVPYNPNESPRTTSIPTQRHWLSFASLWIIQVPFRQASDIRCYDDQRARHLSKILLERCRLS